MIINNTYKFLFIHVPRCGGTSVSAALAGIGTWQDLELGSTPLGQTMDGKFREKFGLHKHVRCTDARSILGHATWVRYYKFALIRHPFDRAVSMYELMKGYECDHPFMAQYPDFNHFIRSAHGFPGPDHTMLPSVDWLYDAAGRLLVDVVYKLEGADMAAMIHDIGLPPHIERKIKIGRENGARYRVDRSTIAPDVIALMRERYARDLQVFGYDPAWDH